MLTLFFYIQIILLVFVWAYFFFTPHWRSSLPIQLVLFIIPFLFGMAQLTLCFELFPLTVIREYQFPIYLYSTINLIFLIPYWYKLMWEILQKIPQYQLNDWKGLSMALIFAIFMVCAVILFFALYYLWLDSCGGVYQGVKSSIGHYQPIALDFSTAFYFSFVTYFTLGYGDLIPYGMWMQLFVFFECLLALLNTGVIIIYVYNFLFVIPSQHNR